MRAAVLLVLALNLAFMAWAQGLLAPLLMPPMASEREPARLTSQLRPELVRVLSTQEVARITREQAAASPGRTAASAAPAPASPITAR